MSATYKLEDKNFELLDVVPTPLVVTEPNGAIIFANIEFEDLVNIDRGIVTGMHIENLFPGLEKKKLSAALSLASQQSENFRLKQQVLFIRRKSRRQIMVDVSMAKQEIHGRKVIIFSFADLSELHTMEEITGVYKVLKS